MVKRLISANASEIMAMTGSELKESIKASEGRVVMSEVVATRESFIGDITNTEIAKSFGADMILLNGVDVLRPNLPGLPKSELNFVETLHKLVARPIGVNLEPVDVSAEMLETKLEISNGRQASKETFKQIETLGMDFVCLTGNPGTGVSNDRIEKMVTLAKKHFSGLIIAGKMHGAGVNEPVTDKETVRRFIEAGADIILVPAVGTVPGFSDADLTEVVKECHSKGALILTAIGTSQESSDESVIKDLAIRNKICGVDIQHIGDAGYGGVAPVLNIMTLSQALRGMRHTVSMMARSINR
ncbi:DUF7916 family protein [Vagococcus fessus]|uniref:PEP phosphonomutase n=1 Tax=Vagococcus fessus TaxID=120370 RepID=A0A430ACG0_9ENTE|nr:haloacid dehalogenase-like hydrolase [Vagococcus fessus]RSU04905.1 PEP phosphonomutase [Vagococcus fessus]